MRILLASDKFKGALPSPEVAAALQHALAEVFPGAEFDTCPIADGGEGTTEAMVGALGGVWAEALGDVVVIPLPADAARVRQGLNDLRGSPVLRGDRGQQTYAIDALCHLASNVGRLLIDSGASLIELNPVIVSSEDAIAVDAVIVRQPTFTAGVDADEAGP